MKKTILVGLLLLGACAAVPTPAQVAALESSLTAAERLALAYTSLPLCPAATKVCADPVVKVKIKMLDNDAYNAVKAVEANPTTAQLVLAETAITALLNYVPAATK